VSKIKFSAKIQIFLLPDYIVLEFRIFLVGVINFAVDFCEDIFDRVLSVGA
jgi:hypothetical protein